MGTPNASLPTLSSAQASEVDRLVAERFAIPIEWLMEAAGWQIARHCPFKTAVLAGKGNNGGDGLAAARHLHRWGRLHSVACTDRTALKGPAAHEAEALEAAGVTIDPEPDLDGAEAMHRKALAIDEKLGSAEGMAEDYGNLGTVLQDRGDLDGRLRRDGTARRQRGDADTGTIGGVGVERLHMARDDNMVGEPHGIKADSFCLLGEGPELSGEIWVADIGIPSDAYSAIGLHLPANPFAHNDQVKL